MESTQTEDAKANTNGNANATREKLMGEMQNVIHEAEGWLRTSTHATGEEFRSARAKFEAALSRAKADVIEFEENVVEKAKQAAHATDDYVKENPWKAVGLGAALGVICGLLIARK